MGSLIFLCLHLVMQTTTKSKCLCLDSFSVYLNCHSECCEFIPVFFIVLLLSCCHCNQYLLSSICSVSSYSRFSWLPVPSCGGRKKCCLSTPFFYICVDLLFSVSFWSSSLFALEQTIASLSSGFDVKFCLAAVLYQGVFSKHTLSTEPCQIIWGEK